MLKVKSAMTAATSSTRRLFMIVIAVLLLIFAALQFVRFVVADFQISNPSATRTITWDSVRTEMLWTQTCGDCHSSATRWPWYAYVAPVGWLVARDVNKGRREFDILNAESRVETDEMIEAIRDGEMPLPIYLPLHPEANLNAEDQAALIAGLRATFRDGLRRGATSN